MSNGSFKRRALFAPSVDSIGQIDCKHFSNTTQIAIGAPIAD